MSHRVEKVQLEEETLSAYAGYVREAEAYVAQSLQAEGPFLWSDRSLERAELVGKGRTIACLWDGKGPIHVPKGLIHDWIGATYIAGATIERTLALLQNYDRHKEIYQPEVIDSKLLSRNGDVFEIYLRLLKKKLITVVLDTNHHVEYGSVSAARSWCRSHTTSIAEVEDAGKPTERARLPDTGYGFLWRLCSYWWFEQRNGGVLVECRAISLTRDVPKGLGWAIEPIIKKLPRESLVATLEATRRSCA
jgi:hypothetical protein